VIEVTPVSDVRYARSIGLTAGCGAFSAVLDLFWSAMILGVFRLVITLAILLVGH
jgi:hypothetical protein